VPKQPPRHYFEASVFVAVIKREVVDGDERWRHCRGLLKDAEEGKAVAVASALTIAEVTGGRGNRPTSGTVEQIRAFFENDWIVVVDVDRSIANRAQDFVWDLSLKPADAIHLATAVATGCAVLYTYDDALLRISGKGKGIRIERPLWEGATQLGLEEIGDSSPSG